MHKHSITKRSRMNNPTWYISTSLISQFSSLRLLRRLCLPEVAALFQLKCLSLCVCVSTSLSPTLHCSSIGIWNALESDNISCIRIATQIPLPTKVFLARIDPSLVGAKAIVS